MMCFHYTHAEISEVFYQDVGHILTAYWASLEKPKSSLKQNVGVELEDSWGVEVDIPAWGWSRSRWAGETCDWDLSSVSRYPPTSEYKDITYWEFISPIFVRFKVYRPQWDLQGHGDVVHDGTLYVSSQWTAVSLHTWSGLCQLRDRDGRGQRGHPPGTVLEILTLFYGKGWDNVKCMEPLLRSEKHVNN